MPEPPGYEQLLFPAEAANRLRINERTLSRWRRAGKGPRFVRSVGGHIRYRVADVNAWIAELPDGELTTRGAPGHDHPEEVR